MNHVLNTLEQGQEIVNNKKRILLLSHIGFWTAFIGYSFHPYLWDSAFYHLISIAFVFYTLALKISSSGRWHWIPFIASTNALLDEIQNKGFVFNWTEYVALSLIALVIFTERKRAIQNIIGLLMKLKDL